jgi:hypothetical protein
MYLLAYMCLQDCTMSIQLLRQADDLADSALRVSNKFLKPTARALLIATFIDDGLRMLMQWDDQVSTDISALIDGFIQSNNSLASKRESLTLD